MPRTQAIWLISGLPGPGFRPRRDSHVPGWRWFRAPHEASGGEVKSRRTAPASRPCLDELGVEDWTSRRARALHSHIGSMPHYPPEERHRARPHSTAGLDPYTRRVGARSMAPRIQGEMTASQLPSPTGPRCDDVDVPWHARPDASHASAVWSRCALLTFEGAGCGEKTARPTRNYHLPHSTIAHGRSFAVAWSTLRTGPRRIANGAGLSGAYSNGR